MPRSAKVQTEPETAPEVVAITAPSLKEAATAAYEDAFDALFAHLVADMTPFAAAKMTRADAASAINAECARVANEAARTVYLNAEYHPCIVRHCTRLAGPTYAACPKHGVPSF